MKKYALLWMLFLVAGLSAQTVSPSRINMDAVRQKSAVLNDSVVRPKLVQQALFSKDSAFFPNRVKELVEENENQLFPITTITETNITLLLTLEQSHAAWKMSSTNNETDPAAQKNIKVKESSLQALDFLEGFQQALKKNEPLVNLNIKVIDASTNDSILREQLTRTDIKSSNIIIGPGKLSSAKIVAEYCKQHKIINIQPFIAATTIGFENPYLVKLAPTIQGHMIRMFKTIVDSMPNAKVVIYSSKRERDLTPARFIDSLLTDYNLQHTKKIQKVLVVQGDASLPAAQQSLTANMGGAKQVALVYCSYDQTAINQTLRGISRGSTIVFGMPTWIDQELIRVEYLNNSGLYFTDAFYADTSQAETKDFTRQYSSNYFHAPSADSYMGFDVANYLSYSLKLYGYNFAKKSLYSNYRGLGYNFLLGEHTAKGKSDGDKTFQYYSNKSVNQFRLEDFKIIHCD